MEPWLLPLLSLVVGIFGGLIGAFMGVRVAVGKLETRMGFAEQEIEKLRTAKHEHAGVLTHHELRIENLERLK
jgi:hypothetical protein